MHLLYYLYQKLHTPHEFLDHISLVMENERNYMLDMINIMTMHSAKGLEFENVFLAGWDEGLFPHQKSLEESGKKALEEERRLAYVGITRGKKKVYISFAKRRYIHDGWNYSQPSRFISEIPRENNNIDDEIEDFNLEDNSYVVNSEEYKNITNNPNKLLFNKKKHDFKIGDEIFHEKYGYGIIKYINDGKLEIIFDKLDTTKIVLENFVKPA